MSKSRLSRANRRKAIVDAAVELFAEVGFRGGTTRELARRAGVTEPVLYEHFQTKSDLYAAIIEASSRQGFEEARGRLEELSRRDNPRTFFMTLARMITDHQRNNPAYFRLILFSALEKHELAELCFERHGRVIHQIVTEFLRRQIDAGVFAEVDAPLTARAFMGMVMHYSLFDQHFGFKLVRASRKRAIETMVEIFLRGLKKT